VNGKAKKQEAGKYDAEHGYFEKNNHKNQRRSPFSSSKVASYGQPEIWAKIERMVAGQGFA